MVDATDMGRREARFYSGLAEAVPVRVPRALWSGWGERSSQYLMLLARNAIPWSLVGFPAISVPVGSVDGLPVGMQFVAGPDHESRLVSVARVIELEMGGHGANGATGSARHRIVIEGETP